VLRRALLPLHLIAVPAACLLHLHIARSFVPLRGFVLPSALVLPAFGFCRPVGGCDSLVRLEYMLSIACSLLPAGRSAGWDCRVCYLHGSCRLRALPLPHAFRICLVDSCSPPQVGWMLVATSICLLLPAVLVVLFAIGFFPVYAVLLLQLCTFLGFTACGSVPSSSDVLRVYLCTFATLSPDLYACATFLTH